MTHPDSAPHSAPHPAPESLLSTRTAAHLAASTHLALLSDRRLVELLAGATPLGKGIGGSSARLEVAGLPVFVKQIPVTELELRPENLRSTANVFELPGFYQYGVGSAGFGVWRELAVHLMTTNWVLGNGYQGFPLLHHWRLLPGRPMATTAEVDAKAHDLAGLVDYWDGSPAVRRRLEGLRDATASLVLFLEYVPQTLGSWLAAQQPDAYPQVDEAVAAGVAFMRGQGLVHFDAHFENILTDGRRLYFTDFGLALSSGFELSIEEREFLTLHEDYDCALTGAHLVNRHLAKRFGASTASTGGQLPPFVRDWAEGRRPEGLPAPAAATLTRHAATAVVMGEFRHRLVEVSKRTPYPAVELRRSCARNCPAGSST
ncbi:hypothetical protein P3T36_006037 [Kitasatospora sp. MAP12-15]|uniref:protein kinase family protein n=1 Tax=unclassified Kitasatospora TaxID=2633591 RepID=UPI002473CAF2|nr:protein kinase family protein [Kitasatospora sp. MAP12-44]MDH6109040.1 hypothetical protein [Kitasatospora sp. MAP12-44]